jgi:N,N-dimethylformamidase
MASQGFDYSGWFRRMPDADNPRAAFVFAGIDDDVIGDFGEIGGGAAGLEFDRTDGALGTPAHTLTLASSEGHSNLSFAVPEEVDNVNDELVATRNADLRGDLTLLETPCGGAVFSFSSIAWAGSLRHNGYANNVAQLTRNVLARFLDPTPLTHPDTE